MKVGDFRYTSKDVCGSVSKMQVNVQDQRLLDFAFLPKPFYRYGDVAEAAEALSWSLCWRDDPAVVLN